MTLQAHLRNLSRLHGLEVQEQTRFLAPRLQMPTARPVAGLAGLPLLVNSTMHVLLHRLRVHLMASQTQFVIVDVLRIRDDGEICS